MLRLLQTKHTRNLRHGVESLMNILHAAPHALRLVRDAVLSAKLAHDLARAVEVAARHRWEKVVFDLVIETTSEPVHEDTRLNVTRRVQLEFHETELLAHARGVQVTRVVVHKHNPT